MYNIVTNLNPLIEGLDKYRSKLDSTVYNITKGEALAIRACIHLDLIRLWGPVPSNLDVAEKYLPYVRVNSTERYVYVTFSEYMEYLFNDLNEAENLLKRSDPVIENTFESTEEISGFLSYRKSR